MKKINSYVITLVLGFCVVLFTGAADLAAETSDEQVVQPVANVSIGAHGLIFQPKVEYAGLALTVATPGGAVFSKTFDSGTTPYFELSELDANSILDGSYTFELVVIPFTGKMARTSGEAAGFEGQGLITEDALKQGGYFTVQGGSIVTMGAAQEGLAKPLDIVHVDDVIIQFSLCVGNDCVNGENFGFDTLRLKENNLRIHFDDTSTSASFPKNDWRITINDSANGGASYFRIDDATNSKSPFTIEANAPSHSLYVDDGGNVGFGTSTPVVNAHIKEGNTPTLRLEQDGSSGFTPQTWDVAGNEANFFVRDATNGSKLPFKIKPGAPNNSLFIAADGDIGVGTQSPDFAFEVERDGANAAVVATRIGGVQNFINATASFGNFGTVNDFPVQIMTNSVWRMRVNTDDTLSMSDGGSYNGTWNPASSKEFKENIENLTVDEAVEALVDLNPVKYNYKIHKDEPRVGFIAEDVPELVALNGKKTLGTVDIVAVLTKVVQEQQKAIEDLKAKISENEK
jgi:hypothetical protein